MGLGVRGERKRALMALGLEGVVTEREYVRLRFWGLVVFP